ncbi:MAG: hypothetical protein JOY99_01640 [Sphingomonadaceae bacterium]|nr:hypothetical protein [Sphingomonadaceae bacterium]
MSEAANDRSAIDLVEFAKALPPEHRALAGAILALRDAQSSRTDLHVAFDFVTSLRQIREPAMQAGVGKLAENCALALMYGAIVLYTRATKSESDHRRTFDPRSKFDDEEKAAHTIICGLRDDAVAHYGPGTPYAGPSWQADGVFAVPPDGQIMTASRRLMIVPSMIDLLEKQVHRALMIADREVQTRNEAVANTLTAAGSEDATLWPLAQRFRVDLKVFLESEAAAEDVLSGSRQGYRRGTSRH